MEPSKQTMDMVKETSTNPTALIQLTVSAAPMMSLWWNIAGGRERVCIGVGVVKLCSLSPLWTSLGTPRTSQALTSAVDSTVYFIQNEQFSSKKWLHLNLIL